MPLSPKVSLPVATKENPYCCQLLPEVQLARLLAVPQRQGPRFYLLGGVSLLSRSAPKLCSLNNSSTN
jgi:hypothetical protein